MQQAFLSSRRPSGRSAAILLLTVLALVWSGLMVAPARSAGNEPGAYRAIPPVRLADTRADMFPVPAGALLQVKVAGAFGVPADAPAVVLNVTATGAAGYGFVTAFPCGTARPNASNLNYTAGQTVANVVVAKVGTDGEVCLYTSQSANLIVDVNGWYPAGSGYTPMAPARLADTRGAGGPLVAGGVLRVKAAGAVGIPAGASAVVVNVTAAGPAGYGFVTVYPCGQARPTASNLNYTSGRTVANAAIAKVGTNGEICLYSSQATNLIVDVSGWQPAGSEYTPMAPARLADTRIGGNPVAAGGVLRVKAASTNSIPADASAVVLNVTVAGPAGYGFVTVFPCGSDRPTASNLNYTAGQAVANAVIAKVGSNGEVCLYTSQATNLIVDVNGWYPPVERWEAVSISGGAVHTCAVLRNGKLACWGHNGNGRLGDGTTEDRLTPVLVSGISNVTAVSAGSAHTCALLSGGKVKCWGRNEAGQLGDGTTEDRLTPTTVPGISSAIAIAAGGRHTCALLSGGTVKCWGWNAAGELGDGSTDLSQTPVAVSGLSGATTITAGGAHTCVLMPGGIVKCWGDDGFGQLGVGGAGFQVRPMAVAGISAATAVSAGLAHTCALLSGGAVKCWGYNGEGGLGDGTTAHRSTPVSVLGLGGVAAVSAGSAHTCALLAGGGLKCWGSNGYGQIGDDSTVNRLTPVAVPGIGGATAIGAGAYNTCVLLPRASLKCWGSNGYGQLGDGTDRDRRMPVPVIAIGA